MIDENTWYKAQYIITYQDNCHDYAVTIRSEENKDNDYCMSGKAKLDIDVGVLTAITSAQNILSDSVANTQCVIVITLSRDSSVFGTKVGLTITATGDPDVSHCDLQNKYFSKIAQEIKSNTDGSIPDRSDFKEWVIH